MQIVGVGLAIVSSNEFSAHDCAGPKLNSRTKGFKRGDQIARKTNSLLRLNHWHRHQPAQNHGLLSRLKPRTIVRDDPDAKTMLAMNEDYAKLIVNFPLFHGFTQHGAQMLMECGEIKDHAPGEVLFQEGDAATFALLVLAGQLQVFVTREGRDLVLREVSPGTILGELAVLCGIPRSASVRAREKSVVLCWRGHAFRRMLLGDGFLSERILGEAMRTLVEKERALIDSLMRAQRGVTTAA
jgi:hypothetical protein